MARTSAASTPAVAATSPHRMPHHAGVLPVLPHAASSSGRSGRVSEAQLAFACVPGWHDCVQKIAQAHQRYEHSYSYQPPAPKHTRKPPAESRPPLAVPRTDKAVVEGTPSEIDSDIFDIE
eukprot:scaffold352206_cov41-Prasinocladus_malaysianus.AAC.1